jgi:hypothetical protein
MSIISDVILEAFLDPKRPADVWKDRGVTIGNLIRFHIQSGWLKSEVPFGRTLIGPESVWTETLVTTDEGLRMLYGETIKP